MYEKSNLKRKNEQKEFYSMKSGKTKNNLENKIILIVGLVFLTGILITFLMKDVQTEENSHKENNISQDGSRTDENNTSIKDEGLSEVPPINGVGPLTAEEVQMVREAIEADDQGYFKLANKENTLDENYKPENLIIPNVGLTKDRSNEQNFVREEISDAVETFFRAAEAAGHEIFLSSGYRSFNLQSIFYNNDLQSNGGIESGYVAAPGTSEHQLGLAIDLTSHSVNLELTEEFGNTPEGKWTLENAHEYGFILRYKADKEEITGYNYEPWHYRYIGNKDIAKLCYEKNLTLEELFGYMAEVN